MLQNHGVQVIVVDDRKEQDTPDSIFPNNWVSFHSDGTVCLYPMFAENRRRERRADLFEVLTAHGFRIDMTKDYTTAEEKGLFLEGTGSILIDRAYQKAYCARSPRAHEALFIQFCEDFDCTPVLFTAYQTVKGKRLPIYHTNVMMAIADIFVVICLDTIDDPEERTTVTHHLKADGREIILITEAQMHQFAGNMLQVMGANDQRLTVMSTTACRMTKYKRLKNTAPYSTVL